MFTVTTADTASEVMMSSSTSWKAEKRGSSEAKGRLPGLGETGGSGYAKKIKPLVGNAKADAQNSNVRKETKTFFIK